MKKKVLLFAGVITAGIIAAIAIPSVAVSVVTNQNNSKNSTTTTTQTPASQPTNPVDEGNSGSTAGNSQLSDIYPAITMQNHSSQFFNTDSSLPATTGNDVSDIAYLNFANQSDYSSSDQTVQKKVQSQLEDTFLFTGGEDVVSDFSILNTNNNFIGLFEQNVRWNYTIASKVTGAVNSNLAGFLSSLSRFCFSTAKSGQTINDLVTNYDTKVNQFDPQNIIYIVGREDIDKGESALSQYEKDLQSFVEKGLAQRDNTATVQIIKHWKVTDKYANSSTFNSNVTTYNKAVDNVVNAIAKKDANAVKRILVVNPVNPQTGISGLDGSTTQATYYSDNGIDLSRSGNNWLAMLLMFQGIPTIGPNWKGNSTDASNYKFVDSASMKGTLFGPKLNWTTQWLDFDINNSIGYRDFTTKPFDWSYTGIKNNKDITATITSDVNDTKKISVTIPKDSTTPNNEKQTNLKDANLTNSNQVSFQLEFLDSGVIINGDATLDSTNSFDITGLRSFNYYDSNALSPITGQKFTNKFALTVFDTNQNPYNKIVSDLNQTTQLSSTTTAYTLSESSLSTAQQAFIKKFEDKSKPLKWGFLGDSVDHCAAHTIGFDEIAKVTEKSVKQDWGRADDTFINVAMSSDMSSRAIDSHLIQARISKYKFDVLSINLGINDNATDTSTNAGKSSKYGQNIIKLINAAKQANPNVTIVLSAIGPTGNTGKGANVTNANKALQEIAQDTTYSGYVIYNDKAYTKLNTLITEYSWMYGDKLMFAGDKLHPSADGHLIKAKGFLDSLGVNTINSYLADFAINRFTDKTTNIDIQTIVDSTDTNHITPDFVELIQANPAGATQLGQIFYTLKPSDPSSGLYTYTIVVAPSTSQITSNNYFFPYVNTGNYESSYYAVPKTESANAYVWYTFGTQS
ncbi:MAG: SGNH/GDSL hydrolase family protein [Malacoplasma sp.]|nr:SGNH/GDSL hydrolase family protein [Malacoplasma sp.]